MIGSELAGRYRVIREIGRGGMGVVFQAYDPLLDRDVAVKVLDPEAISTSAARRFEREARAIAKLDHPSIMPIFDIGHEGRSMFFVMPMARGSSLRTMLDGGALGEGTAATIAIHVADALAHSHASGIVHRDVKPENIMMTGSATDPRPLVTDFGLAVSDGGEERLTQSGTIIGTAAYLAPEQIRSGGVDVRTDIYALGVVLYEMLSGLQPFIGPIPGILEAIVHDPPPPLQNLREDLDAELGRIVMWCLEKDPARRPQQITEVGDALRRYQTRGNTESSASPSATRILGRSREIEMFERLLDAARGGEAHLLLVAGDAGAGKTRIIEQFETICGQRGIAFLSARFHGGSSGFPYQAYSDLLQSWAQSTPAEQVRQAMADCADDLLTLFPILRETESLRQLSTTAQANAKEKGELFELLAGSIRRIGDGKLLVVALEELHSANVSIEVLQYLLARLAPVPLLVVGTLRPAEVARKHPLHSLLEEAKRDQRVHLATLRPLDAADHRELLRQIVKMQAVSSAANERIFAITEGNPFFVQELARSLVEAGKLAFDGFEWKLSDEADLDAEALPPTIQQAVERRIEALDSEARAVLETASVAGKSFDLADVEQLIERDDIEDEIHRLVREGFLREERGRGERFAFSSALMREVAYAGVPRRRRRTLHRRFATALEERNAGRVERVLSELLHHYAEADVAEKVVEYGLPFARKSLASFSAAEALMASRLVLDFLEEDADARSHATEARTIAAKAHRMTGSFDAALRELELVYRGGDPEQALAAAAEAAETAWEARRIDDAGLWVHRGLTAGGDAPDPTRRLLGLAATLANLRGDVESARQLFARADALDARTSHRPSLSGHGGLIRVPIAGDLFSLDPSLTFTLTHLETLALVYENLTHETEGVRIAPWLASSIEPEESGRHIRIGLNDVRFHDGRRVTSEDVRASFERLLRNPAAESRWMLAPVAGAREYGEGLADRIEGLRIVSDHELVLELQEPVSFFPALLAHAPAAVVPHDASMFQGSWRDGCVGTGPFRVTNFESGRELRLEASPLYWREGFPRADGIVFTLGVPPAEIAAGLRDGTFDIGWDLLPEDLDDLRRDPRFARGFRETPRLSTYYIAFNINHGPLRDEALRHEIADALDVEKLVASLGRVAMPARGFIPPGLLGYEPARRRTARRIPRSNSSRLSLQAMLNSAYEGPYATFASRLYDAFSAIGIDIAVLQGKSEYATHQAETLASAEILFTRWIADFPDAHDFVALLHSQTGVVGRVCGTPELDRLIERGARESDPEVRHQLYRRIEDILAEHALLVPLFHEQSYRVARPEVQDFAINYFAPLVAYDRIWIG